MNSENIIKEKLSNEILSSEELAQESNDEYQQMKLGKIKEGTVLDHIPPELCFKIVNLLNLEQHGRVISAATNLTSTKMGKKGMIKISGKILNEKEVNRIAVVAPNITYSIIKDYLAIKKIKLNVPQEIFGIVKCNNPNCITNIESVQTKFMLVNEQPLKIKCNYCERTTNKEDIKLLM